MSRAIKRQCATLAFLNIILENLNADTRKHKKTRDCLARIESRKNKLFYLATGCEMGEFQDNSYSRLLQDVIKMMRKLPHRLIALDWVNASLLAVEDQLEEIPDTKKSLKREWSWLAGSLNTLYNHFDSKLDHYISMGRGKLVGENFREVVS